MTRSLILRCPDCLAYSLHEKCPKCGHATRNPLPPKFSPEDHYGAYRRQLRRLAASKGA